MGLPAKSPQAILWGPRKEGEQYSHVKDVHPFPPPSTTLLRAWVRFGALECVFYYSAGSFHARSVPRMMGPPV